MNDLIADEILGETKFFALYIAPAGFKHCKAVELHDKPCPTLCRGDKVSLIVVRDTYSPRTFARVHVGRAKTDLMDLT